MTKMTEKYFSGTFLDKYYKKILILPILNPNLLKNGDRQNVS
jgi:hypothetical protein